MQKYLEKNSRSFVYDFMTCWLLWQLGRLWSSGCRSRYQGALGRLKFLRRPFCIIGKGEGAEILSSSSSSFTTTTSSSSPRAAVWRVALCRCTVQSIRQCQCNFGGCGGHRGASFQLEMDRLPAEIYAIHFRERGGRRRRRRLLARGRKEMKRQIFDMHLGQMALQTTWKGNSYACSRQ